MGIEVITRALLRSGGHR